MVRKLVSATVVILLATLGLVQTSSANATEPAPISLPEETQIWQGYPLAGERVFLVGTLWDNATSKQSFFGLMVEANGKGSSPIVFDGAKPNTTNFSISDQSLVQLADGSLALSWATYDGVTKKSQLSFASSTNGIKWSKPTHPVADYVASGSGCEQFCGFNQPRLAADGKNRIGLMFSTETSGDGTARAPVSLVSKIGTSKWSSATSISETLPRGGWSSPLSLFGLPTGGFSLTWNFRAFMAEGYAIQSGIWLPGTDKFQKVVTFQPPVADPLAISRTLNNLVGKPIKLSSTEFVQLFSDTASDFTAGVYWSRFSTVTKAWTPLVALSNPATGYVPWYVTTQVMKDIDGTVYLGYVFQGDGSKDIRMVSVRSGSAPQAFNSVQQISSQGYVALDAIDRNPNGTLSIYFTEEDGINRSRSMFMRMGDSISNPALIPTTEMRSYRVIGTALGNHLIVETADQTDIVTIYLEKPERRPVISALPKISGLLKKNATVSVSSPKFYSPNGVGASSFQWYRCEQAVPVNEFNRVAESCSPIPGATKSTYKVSSGDKNAFLLATVSSSNALGSTQVSSKSTTVVK
jgi:hypothetical protein